MNKPSVSFIIPYYKVELALLERAVESVRRLEQYADWDIWIIDDGTPGTAAQEYAEALKDTRIHYHKQPNNGPGGARNTGMRLAQKEYIHFLDADDYLFFTPTRQAIQLLQQQKPDLLGFQFRKVFNKTLTDLPTSDPKIRFSGNGIDFMLHHNMYGSVWSYFFRKSIAEDIRFTPIAYHEDEEFTAFLFLKAKTLLITTLPVYAYYQRRGSIMHDQECQSVKKRFLDLIHILTNMKSKVRELPSPAAQALNRRTDLMCMSMVYTLLGDSPDSHFLLDMLRRMKQAGLYPLAPHAYTLPYIIIRMLSSTPAAMVIVSKFFRMLHFRHAGPSVE